ncbi:restriction endonuclease subunit S [Mycoplasmopsis columboralis]|uniref:Type I restriction-modification system subunit S n=1 Tax=Mycoplasmopsis columboralis TaxID=171282 RepID=A0A449B650_9BACT|nr:restriction endonuclease subunit S [Mycoplasmopsis columboralis]VEU76049.1 type I restriction-modification system subunit S [Mycoplasmopsis columboralis]
MNLTKKKLWEVTIWDKKFQNVDLFKQESIKKYKYFFAKEIDKFVELSKINEENVKVLTTYESDIFVNRSLVDEFVSNEEIIAIPGGGYPIVQYYKGAFVTTDNRIAVVKDKEILRTKYLYYFLKNNINTIVSFYRGSGIKHPNMSDILEMEIAIPSIEEQDKIIDKLDKFTTFSAELKAELKARKEQYTYYRNYLLSDEKLNNVYKLKELADMRYGEGNTIPNNGGVFPVYGSNGIVGYTDKWNNEDGIIIGHVGTVGNVIWASGKHFVTYNGTICRAKKEKISDKYLYHCLKSLSLEKYKKGNQPFLSISDIDGIKIKIPSLNIQNKIVYVLDNFEKICEDLNIGLPSELNLREQQYSYYRDKLLSFAQGTLEVSPERERERLAKCSQTNWIHIQTTITQNWWI